MRLEGPFSDPAEGPAPIRREQGTPLQAGRPGLSVEWVTRSYAECAECQSECLIHEDWAGAQGGTGRTFNASAARRSRGPKTNGGRPRLQQPARPRQQQGGLGSCVPVERIHDVSFEPDAVALKRRHPDRLIASWPVFGQGENAKARDGCLQLIMREGGSQSNVAESHKGLRPGADLVVLR